MLMLPTSLRLFAWNGYENNDVAFIYKSLCVSINLHSFIGFLQEHLSICSSATSAYVSRFLCITLPFSPSHTFLWNSLPCSVHKFVCITPWLFLIFFLFFFFFCCCFFLFFFFFLLLLLGLLLLVGFLLLLVGLLLLLLLFFFFFFFSFFSTSLLFLSLPLASSHSFTFSLRSPPILSYSHHSPPPLPLFSTPFRHNSSVSMFLSFPTPHATSSDAIPLSFEVHS